MLCVGGWLRNWPIDRALLVSCGGDDVAITSLTPLPPLSLPNLIPIRQPLPPLAIFHLPILHFRTAPVFPLHYLLLSAWPGISLSPWRRSPGRGGGLLLRSEAAWQDPYRGCQVPPVQKFQSQQVQVDPHGLLLSISSPHEEIEDLLHLGTTALDALDVLEDGPDAVLLSFCVLS